LDPLALRQVAEDAHDEVAGRVAAEEVDVVDKNAEAPPVAGEGGCAEVGDEAPPRGAAALAVGGHDDVALGPCGPLQRAQEGRLADVGATDDQHALVGL
jgi:hypothetical protein